MFTIIIFFPLKNDFFFKDLKLLYLSFLFLEKIDFEKVKLLGITFHFKAKNDSFNKIDFLINLKQTLQK